MLLQPTRSTWVYKEGGREGRGEEWGGEGRGEEEWGGEGRGGKGRGGGGGHIEPTAPSYIHTYSIISS